ncbi:hypothetical protein T265_14933, partial [Opisthorchis viverrini]
FPAFKPCGLSVKHWDVPSIVAVRHRCKRFSQSVTSVSTVRRIQGLSNEKLAKRAQQHWESGLFSDCHYDYMQLVQEEATELLYTIKVDGDKLTPPHQQGESYDFLMTRPDMEKVLVRRVTYPQGHHRRAGALAELTKPDLATQDQWNGAEIVHDRNTATGCAERTRQEQNGLNKSEVNVIRQASRNCKSEQRLRIIIGNTWRSSFTGFNTNISGKVFGDGQLSVDVCWLIDTSDETASGEKLVKYGLSTFDLGTYMEDTLYVDLDLLFLNEMSQGAEHCLFNGYWAPTHKLFRASGIIWKDIDKYAAELMNSECALCHIYGHLRACRELT